MLRRTPLFTAHQRLGARLVEFGGWEMPLQYTSILDEHQAVRTAAGLFDISHMGEFLVSGPGAAAFLNHTLTNDVRRLAVGQGQYTLLCNAVGGVVDDLYVYRIRDDEFMLIVNAARTNADWDWLQTQVDHAPTRGGLKLRDVSSAYGALAVQGPRVAEFIDPVIPGGSIGGTLAPNVTRLARNQIGGFAFRGTSLLVARTGYTGEDGFEVFAPAAQIGAVWEALIESGRPFGLRPAGLGARDTLRTEMGYPLYGHELGEDITPIEAGLGAFVAFDKGDFMGRARLEVQKANSPEHRCVAFAMTAKSAPPRPGYSVWGPGAEAKVIGSVVSGTQSPSLGIGIGMSYVASAWAKPDQEIAVEIRGQRAPARIVRKPIYRRTAAAPPPPRASSGELH